MLFWRQCRAQKWQEKCLKLVPPVCNRDYILQRTASVNDIEPYGEESEEKGHAVDMVLQQLCVKLL